MRLIFFSCAASSDVSVVCRASPQAFGMSLYLCQVVWELHIQVLVARSGAFPAITQARAPARLLPGCSASWSPPCIPAVIVRVLRSELCGCGVNVQIGGGRAPWAACGGHRCSKPTPSAFIGGVGLLQPAAVITSCLCVGCRVSLLFYLWAIQGHVCRGWWLVMRLFFCFFCMYIHTVLLCMLDLRYLSGTYTHAPLGAAVRYALPCVIPCSLG